MKETNFTTHATYQRLITWLAILMMIPLWSHAAEQTNLRGKRYCEIIITKALREFAVYTTWGLNDCPEKTWAQESVEGVKNETGAHFAHLNGPRYWVMDGFENTRLINPNIKTIGGLKLREAGVLHMSLVGLLKSKTSYLRRTVDRQTTWVYQPGKPIYELIDPTGTVFVMQSYSIQKNPQTMESLSQLGTKLRLPEGWHFKTGTLKTLERLKAINNQATVVQDDYLNTYQMITKDFLA